MRVLFLSQVVPYPPHGGVLQRGYNLIRELSRHAKVHLLAFVHPNLLPTPEAVVASRAALGQWCEAVEYFPLWVKRSPIAGALGVAWSALSPEPFSVIAHRSVTFEQRVDALLAAGTFDVVHADTVALMRFLGRSSRCPRVLTHHNIESQLLERRAGVEQRVVARRFLRREAAKLLIYERAAAQLVDVNVLVSRDDERELLGRVPAVATSIVPNGVDVNYFTPGTEEEEPALIFTGGMGMFANRDAVSYFLREVWPLIRDRHSEVRFVAVGRSPTKEAQEHVARDGRVSVTGFVDDIRPLVRRSAVYVVPLRVGGGTRLKVLDAMAMGKAIVSTSIGCEGLRVDDRHLVQADTPQEFATATLALLKAPAKRKVLGRAARQLAETEYAWPAMADRLMGAYRDAIDRGRSRG